MRCIDKMRMGRAEVPGERVHCVVSNEDARFDVEHAIVCVQLFNGGAPAGRITLPENLLKVSIEKFNNSLRHRESPCIPRLLLSPCSAALSLAMLARSARGLRSCSEGG